MRVDWLLMLSNGRWTFWVDIFGNKFDANIRSLLRISIYLMNYFWQIFELKVMDVEAKWPINGLRLHRCGAMSFGSWTPYETLPYS